MPHTVGDAIELVRFELRRYGFRADGGTISKSRDGQIVAEFEVEPATGQAAFSQDSVKSHLRIWVKELAAASGSVIPLEKPCCIDVSVGYTHCGNSGRNGWSARYELSRESFSDSAKLTRKV